MRLLITICALLAACGLTAAQSAAEDSCKAEVFRPVVSAYTVQAGSSHLRDTYLTPLGYSGWAAGIGYERFQAMKFDPERWIMRLEGTFGLSSDDNPARTATMWSIDFTPSWAMMRRFRPAPRLTLAVGGIARGNLGVLYLARNSNNPASVKASVTVGITAMATYSVTLGRLPVTLRCQPSFDLLGAFFSPDYDELYYEIWLGNHSGLCHCAWPGNFVHIDNLLTADLRFGATNLRLGYRFELLSTKASGIVSRAVSHQFVIGIATEWLSVHSGRRSIVDSRLISAFY